MDIGEYTFVPLEEEPTEEELLGTNPLQPVTVIMTTFVDFHTGRPKFVREMFRDPDDGEDKVVWSRVTDSLAYVRARD